MLGLVLRLAHLATIHTSPFFTHLGLDPLAYDEWGRRIAGGEWLGHRIFYQDPLYPYFLGVIYAAAGHGYVLVVAIQCLLGSLEAPLIFDATRRWLGRPAALVAGLMAALYAPSIYCQGLILKTWLGAFLVTLALWLLSMALARCGARGVWTASGVVLALACLVRGNILLFLPVLVAWILLDPSALRGPGTESPQGAARPWRDPAAWRAAGALLAGAALVLGITATRNRVVGGEWVLTTSQGGQNFYIGNNPGNANGRYDPLPFVGANPKYEEKGFAEEAARRTGRTLRPTEVSRYWFGESLRWMRQRPGDWLRLTWLKLRNYWGAYEVPDNLDYYLYRRDAPVLRLPLLTFGLVVPLGLTGVALAWRRPGWPRLLLLFAAVYAASVILFFVFSRYRLPMLPALFPFAGHAVAEGARRARVALANRRQAGGVLRAAAAFLLLFAFVNLPVAAPASYWSYRLAEQLGLPRHLESTAAGHYNLGLSYAAQAEEAGDPERLLRLAVEEFRAALREDPRYAKPYAELGKVLARLGENAAALEVYAMVVRLEPDRPRPFHVMGILHRRLGDLPAAAAAFRRALELDPSRVDSATDLGEVLLAQGRRAEAAAAFRQALTAAPGHPPAVQGLAAAEGGP